jgi:hypothetical protein
LKEYGSARTKPALDFLADDLEDCPRMMLFMGNTGNQNIFLEKNHNLPFKLNGCSLMSVQLTLQDIRAKD